MELKRESVELVVVGRSEDRTVFPIMYHLLLRVLKVEQREHILGVVIRARVPEELFKVRKYQEKFQSMLFSNGDGKWYLFEDEARRAEPKN